MPTYMGLWILGYADLLKGKSLGFHAKFLGIIRLIIMKRPSNEDQISKASKHLCLYNNFRELKLRGINIT